MQQAIQVKLENIGPLKKAEFEVDKLTIICGENNTGKTYATYTFFGFVNFIDSSEITSIDYLTDNIVYHLYQKKSYTMVLDEFHKFVAEYLPKLFSEYQSKIHSVFSSNPKNFTESQFYVQYDTKTFDLFPEIDFTYILHSVENQLFQINLQNSSDNQSLEFKIAPFNTKNNYQIDDGTKIDKTEIEGYTIRLLNEVIRKSILPNINLIGSERTGTTIFQRIVDTTQNNLIQFLKNEEISLHQIRSMLNRFTGDYTLSVSNNINFIRNAVHLINGDSFIKEQNSDILVQFNRILGGDYTVSLETGIRFIPTGSNKSYSLEESSSTVRSLVHIGLYLKHVAKHGDLLIIDEPELNLHPENQRKIARLLARLVNVGIRVFITTHSDHILREFNTLILLNQPDKPSLKEFMANENYSEHELLNVDGIRAYISVPMEESNNAVPSFTLKSCAVKAGYGIEAESFNGTIDEMGRIQQTIYSIVDNE